LNSITDNNFSVHRRLDLNQSTEIVQFLLEPKTNSDIAEHLKGMVEALAMVMAISNRHRNDPEHR
jgi:hypothetical protein